MEFSGMRARRRAATLLLLLGPLSGSCVIDQVFACSDNASCESGGDGGTCEINGYCSFPDTDCDSGQRYGSLAGGGFAGQCVDDGASGTDGPTTTTPTTGPSTTAVSSATAPTETSPGSDTTDASDPTGEPTTSSSSTGAAQCADWWDCRWYRRRALSIPALNLAEALTEFPVPVPLARDIEGDIDRASLRVVGPAGELWAHEHESDVLWVRVPELPTNTALFATVYYDNAKAQDTADPAAVWNADYLAAWHMNDARDVSPHENHGTALDVEYVPGVVGAATRFDGAQSRLQVPATDVLADLLADGFTVSAWIQSEGQANFPRVVDKSDAGESTRGWSMLLDHTAGTGRLRFDVGFDEGEQVSYADITDETGWNHVAVSARLGQVSMFINGEAVEVQSGPIPIDPPDSDANLTVGIGARNNARPLNVFAGSLDEIRISSIRRSPAWIAATFRTAQPGGISLGPEEQAPPN